MMESAVLLLCLLLASPAARGSDLLAALHPSLGPSSVQGPWTALVARIVESLGPRLRSPAPTNLIQCLEKLGPEESTIEVDADLFGPLASTLLCSIARGSSCPAQDSCLPSGPVQQVFEELLSQLDLVYRFPVHSSTQCFSASSLSRELEDLPVNSETVPRLLLWHMLKGDCKANKAVEEFVSLIFSKYGDKTSNLISVKGLEHLLSDLRHDRHDGHDHDGHDHEHSHMDHEHHQTLESHVHSALNHSEHDHQDDKEDNSQQEASHDHSDHAHSGHDHSDHDHSSHDHSDHDHSSHDHSDHDHSNHDHSDHDHSNHDHSDHDHHINSLQDHSHEEEVSSNQQPSIPHIHQEHDHPKNFSTEMPNQASYLLNSTTASHHVDGESIKVVDIAPIVPEYDAAVDPESNQTVIRFKRHINLEEHAQDSNNATGHKCLKVPEVIGSLHLPAQGPFTPEDFVLLCPALVQQAVMADCRSPPASASELSTLEMYGYSSLAVFIISLTSVAGVFFLPILHKQSYHSIMAGCIGLAFSTLASDALLHLLPQALGVHNHSHGGHDHDGPITIASIPHHMWLQLGVLGAIYFLFLFESISNILAVHRRGAAIADSSLHSHSHIPDFISPNDHFPQKTESKTSLNPQSGSSITDPETGSFSSRTSAEANKPHKICGLTTLALMVTIGDTIHNFGDGLAIGAAFSTGFNVGLSTSLAILCHELPHEFGDFAVLLASGLKFWKALLVNFLSALSCFGGLYLGLLLGDNPTARTWILAVTAGIFLYVALTEMLPELKETTRNPWKMFLYKNIGILTGVFLMVVIAVFEDKIRI